MYCSASATFRHWAQNPPRRSARQPLVSLGRQNDLNLGKPKHMRTTGCLKRWCSLRVQDLLSVGIEGGGLRASMHELEPTLVGKSKLPGVTLKTGPLLAVVVICMWALSMTDMLCGADDFRVAAFKLFSSIERQTRVFDRS